MKKRGILFVVILGVFLCFMGSNIKHEKQQKFVLASGMELKKILLGEKAGGIVKNAAFIINAVREGEKDTTNEEIVIERIDKSIENEKGEVLGIAYYDKPVIVTSDSEGIKIINAFYEEEAKEWFGSGGKITANVENYYEYFCESLEEMKEIWGEEVLVDNPLHYRVDTQIEYVDNNTISIFQIVDVLIGTRGWIYYGNTFDLNTGELIPITDLVEIDAEGLQKIMLDGTKGSWNQVDYTCLKGNNYSVKYYDTEIDMRYAYFFDGKNFYFTDNLSGHDGKLIKWNGEWGSNYEVEVLDEENKRYDGGEFRNSELGAETVSLAEAIGETVVILEGDFYQKMDANPIDSYFIFEDAATESRIMRAGQYYNAWIDEIDNSMIVLKDYLSEEDYLLLESSYTGWKQYVESTMDIEQSIFYIGSDYMENSLFAGAGLTYPRVMEVNAIRARNYAIELKALEYTFTENIDFVFDSENMEKKR